MVLIDFFLVFLCHFHCDIACVINGDFMYLVAVLSNLTYSFLCRCYNDFGVFNHADFGCSNIVIYVCTHIRVYLLVFHKQAAHLMNM